MNSFLVLAAIAEKLETITPEMVDRFGNKLRAPSDSEKTIGWIQKDQTKRLYVAALLFHAESNNLEFQMTIAPTDKESDDLQKKADRVSWIADAAHALFKAEVGLELNYFEDFALRRDYFIFAKQKPMLREPPEELKRVFEALGMTGIGIEIVRPAKDDDEQTD